MIVVKHNLRNKISKRKQVLEFPGIQSSCGISYNRANDEIMNHIFPDVDRTKGVLVNVDATTRYMKNRLHERTSRQNPIERWCRILLGKM